ARGAFDDGLAAAVGDGEAFALAAAVPGGAACRHAERECARDRGDRGPCPHASSADRPHRSHSPSLVNPPGGSGGAGSNSDKANLSTSVADGCLPFSSRRRAG